MIWEKIRENKFLKNGFISLIGTFLIRAVNLISIPVFSRMMGTSEYGEANIFLTYVEIFMILLGLDFHGAVSKGQLDFKEDKDKFMSVGIFFTGIYTALVIILFNIFHGLIERCLLMSNLQLNILLVYSYATFVVTYMSSEYIFQLQYKKNIALSLSVALCNFGCSVLFIQTICSQNRFWGRILGAAIPTIVIASTVFIYLIVRGRKLFDRTYIIYFLKYGIPLIPHNLSHMILSNADKIMIKNMISSSASGVYSLVSYVGYMVMVLIEALDKVWIPWLFRKIKEEDIEAIRKASKNYIFLFTVVIIAVEIISPEIVKIIAPVDYWEGADFIIWIVFGAFLLFLYRIYVNIEFYERKTYLISIGTLLAAIINIVLNALFLKKYGYEFAAISTVISYFALMVFHMLIVNFVIKRKMIDNKFVLLIAGVVFLISCVLQMLHEQFVIRLLLFFVFSCGFCIYVLNWKQNHKSLG